MDKEIKVEGVARVANTSKYFPLIVTIPFWYCSKNVNVTLTLIRNGEKFSNNTWENNKVIVVTIPSEFVKRNKVKKGDKFGIKKK